MVKRRPPAPEIDEQAAAAFIAGADAPTGAPAPKERVESTAQRPAPAPAPVSPAPVVAATGEKVPSTMLLRFKDPSVDSAVIAQLARHHDRSKHYIAYAALVRGLQVMKAEAEQES